jgi:hypothetical protein
MTPEEIELLTVKSDLKYEIRLTSEQSEWSCYLFGNRPGGYGLIYTPKKDCEPNWFVRWMMKICFDCTWVREK